MDDENNGGQHYSSIKVMRTNLFSSKAPSSSTFMRLTAATRETVLCIFILAAKSLSVIFVKGFDYRASVSYESSNNME